MSNGSAGANLQAKTIYKSFNTGYGQGAVTFYPDSGYEGFSSVSIGYKNPNYYDTKDFTNFSWSGNVISFPSVCSSINFYSIMQMSLIGSRILKSIWINNMWYFSFSDNTGLVNCGVRYNNNGFSSRYAYLSFNET